MNRNRLKLWLYMLLFAFAGAANLFSLTGDLAARALRGADDGVKVGAAHLRDAERLMASETAAVTGLAVKNVDLLETLFAAPPRTDPGGKKKPRAAVSPNQAAEGDARWAANEVAARTAVDEAASRLGITLPASAFLAVASPEWIKKRLPGALQDPRRKESAVFLRDAAAGTPRHGYVRVNDGLWYGVAYPAGEGASLALFLPLDLAWARSLAATSGVDVTIEAGTPQLVTTTQPELARRLAGSATAAPNQPISEGTVPPVLLENPIRMRVPVLFVKAPAARAMAVPLTGLSKVFLILSVPTVGYFSDLARYQWTLLTILIALLVVGLLLGVLVKTEVLPVVPASLVAAATKIERGDYSARAPSDFLGALGTVAGALNQAAAAAEAGTVRLTSGDPFSSEANAQKFRLPAEPSSSPPPASAPPPFSPGAQPATGAATAGPRPPATGEQRDGPGRVTSGTGISISTLEVGKPAVPPPPAAGPPAVPVRPAATALFQAATPPAAAEQTDDEHWRSVHTEFLRVRAQCGETVEGLGYERFKPKLEKNRTQLIEKHGCRSVRFSVYVKDGKAALRATPVK